MLSFLDFYVHPIKAFPLHFLSGAPKLLVCRFLVHELLFAQINFKTLSCPSFPFNSLLANKLFSLKLVYVSLYFLIDFTWYRVYGWLVFSFNNWKCYTTSIWLSSQLGLADTRDGERRRWECQSVLPSTTLFPPGCHVSVETLFPSDSNEEWVLGVKQSGN